MFAATAKTTRSATAKGLLFVLALCSYSTLLTGVNADSGDAPWALGIQVLVRTNEPQSRQSLSQSAELSSALELLGIAILDKAASDFHNVNLRRRGRRDLSVAYESLAIRSIVESDKCAATSAAANSNDPPAIQDDCFEVVVQLALQLKDEPDTNSVCSRLEAASTKVALAQDKIAPQEGASVAVLSDEPMVVFCLAPDQAENWQLQEGSDNFSGTDAPAANVVAGEQANQAATDANVIVPITIAAVVVVLLITCVCIVDKVFLQKLDMGIVGRGDIESFDDEPDKDKKVLNRSAQPGTPMTKSGSNRNLPMTKSGSNRDLASKRSGSNRDLASKRSGSNRDLTNKKNSRNLPSRTKNFSDISTQTSATVGSAKTARSARSSNNKDPFGPSSTHSRSGGRSSSGSNGLGGGSSHATRGIGRSASNSGLGSSSLHGRAARPGIKPMGGNLRKNNTSSGAASVASTRSTKTTKSTRTSTTTGTKKSRASTKRSLASMDI